MDIIKFILINHLKNNKANLLILIGVLLGFFNGYSFSLLLNEKDRLDSIWRFFIFFNIFYFLSRNLLPSYRNPRIIDKFYRLSEIKKKTIEFVYDLFDWKFILGLSMNIFVFIFSKAYNISMILFLLLSILISIILNFVLRYYIKINIVKYLNNFFSLNKTIKKFSFLRNFLENEKLVNIISFMFFIKALMFSVFLALLLKNKNVNPYYLSLLFFPVLLNTYFFNNIFVLSENIARNIFFAKKIFRVVLKIYYKFYFAIVLIDILISILMIKVLNLICYNYIIILNFKYFIHYLICSFCLFIIGLLFSYNLPMSINKGLGKQNTTNFISSIITLIIVFMFSYSYLNFDNQKSIYFAIIIICIHVLATFIYYKQLNPKNFYLF